MSYKRIDILEEARYLAVIEKKYRNALSLLHDILEKDSSDVDALRLKGNIFDLMALDQDINSSE